MAAAYVHVPVAAMVCAAFRVLLLLPVDMDVDEEETDADAEAEAVEETEVEEGEAAADELEEDVAGVDVLEATMSTNTHHTRNVNRQQ